MKLSYWETAAKYKGKYLQSSIKWYQCCNKMVICFEKSHTFFLKALSQTLISGLYYKVIGQTVFWQSMLVVAKLWLERVLVYAPLLQYSQCCLNWPNTFFALLRAHFLGPILVPAITVAYYVKGSAELAKKGAIERLLTSSKKHRQLIYTFAMSRH